MKTLSTKLLAAIICAGTCATPLFAQSEQTLKVSFIFPQSHWLWEQGGEVFANKVTQATDGRVTFTAFPAGQLGKQTAGAVRSGIADMGIAVPSYEADKFPLTSVGELPGMHGSACEGTAKLWNLMKEGEGLELCRNGCESG